MPLGGPGRERGVNMGKTLEKRKRLGGHWGLLGCRTPGCEVGAGVLALVGRASEIPGRETWHKGVHGGSCCSPGYGDMLPVELARSSRAAVAVAVAVAAAAGGDGGVLGLVGGHWTGLQ